MKAHSGLAALRSIEVLPMPERDPPLSRLTLGNSFLWTLRGDEGQHRFLRNGGHLSRPAGFVYQRAAIVLLLQVSRYRLGGPGIRGVHG